MIEIGEPNYFQRDILCVTWI